MGGALIRYRVMAFIVGTALIILVFVAIPLQYWGNVNMVAEIVAPIHGYLYLVYLVAGGRPGPTGPLAPGTDPGGGGRRLRALSGLHRRAPGVPQMQAECHRPPRAYVEAAGRQGDDGRRWRTDGRTGPSTDATSTVTTTAIGSAGAPQQLAGPGPGLLCRRRRW